jgi:hypothetical protein
MAEYGAVASLATPYETIVFNDITSPAMYLHNPENCSGLDGDTVRATIEDKPQTHGGIVHPGKRGPRRIVLSGLIIVDQSLSAWDQIAQRNGIERELQLALRSIQDEDGTYTWSQSGVGEYSLTVRNDIGLTVVGGLLKTYNFGLVAADPDY